MPSETDPNFLLIQPKGLGVEGLLPRGTRLHIDAIGKGKKAAGFDAEVVAATPQELQKFVSRLRHYVEEIRAAEISPTHYRFQIRFGLHREPALSPTLLIDFVAPLLQAVFELQRIIAPKQRGAARIRSITQSSPVEVSCEGVADVYKALADDVIPWRRQHQKQLADLQKAERAQEIAKKKAEVALAEAQTATQIAEARKVMAEAERVEQEVEAQRFALNRQKLEFVVEMAAKLLPNGSDMERLELVNKLLPNMSTLLLAPAEMRPMPDVGSE